jgi:hypothetical protein
MVTIMTDLWFRRLLPQDRVSVKPHASPVLHALNYLTGQLDASYLTALRQLGGLQSYPLAKQGSGSGGLLDRVGGDRSNGAHLGSDRAPVCRRAAGTAD